jgi:hypothetical protein
MGGLELAYKIPRLNKQMSRSVVVVTDGYVGVETQAFRFIRERLNDANLFSFGIGSSVNRGLIEGMARAGQGEPFVVLRPEKAAAEAEKLRAYIEQPVLAGVSVAFSGFDTYEVAPRQLPDLMARRPLVMFGKYRGTAGGRIEVKGQSGGGPIRQVIEVRQADVRQENAALRWLWARRWVQTFEDELAMGAGQPAEDGITALGLDYRLLTAFTSFVAIDSQVVNQGGQGQNVRQPLPMPEGVSNLAVGGPQASLLPMKAMGVMGSGSGYGAGGLGHAAPAATSPVAPAPPPVSRKRSMSYSSADGLSLDEERAANKHEAMAGKKEPQAKDRDDGRKAPAAPTWIVSAGKSTTVGATAPLVEAIRAALAAGRAPCLAASDASKPIRVRLTIDAQGRIVRVELVTGDRNAETCLRAALTGLSSATVAHAAPTGTVEITLRARS